jgi:pullulanase/glycogen debranching enzyme
MTEEKWNHPDARFLTVRLSPTQRGEPALLVMFNASDHDLMFKVPNAPTPRWRTLLDTADESSSDEVAASQEIILAARSLRLMEAAA